MKIIIQVIREAQAVHKLPQKMKMEITIKKLI